MGRNQCVLNSFNATSYISLDGNHFFYKPHIRITLRTVADQMPLHLMNS